MESQKIRPGLLVFTHDCVWAVVTAPPNEHDGWFPTEGDGHYKSWQNAPRCTSSDPWKGTTPSAALIERAAQLTPCPTCGAPNATHTTVDGMRCPANSTVTAFHMNGALSVLQAEGVRSFLDTWGERIDSFREPETSSWEKWEKACEAFALAQDAFLRVCPHPAFTEFSAGPLCTLCAIMQTCQVCGEDVRSHDWTHPCAHCGGPCDANTAGDIVCTVRGCFSEGV